MSCARNWPSRRSAIARPTTSKPTSNTPIFAETRPVTRLVGTHYRVREYITGRAVTEIPTMVVDISDISTDSTDTTNDSDNSASDSHENGVEVTLDPVFDTIGADTERVREFIKEQDKGDAITDLAKALKDDDELWAMHEEYRRFTDLKRIIENYLYNRDDEFSAFTDEFWGDYDDPEPGTFNYVQSAVRDHESGNLFFYKVMFPEPVEEHWDGEAVVWQEKPEQDSHIYVTEDFVNQYSQFTMEVDGQSVPRPPNDEEVAAMSGRDSSESASTYQDVPIDTTEVTVSELKEQVRDSLAELSRDQLSNLYDHEEANKDRKTAKAFLEQEMETIGHDDGGDEGSAESDTSGDESPEARAGRIMGEYNLNNVSPDFIRGIVKGNPDATDEEIVAMCE